MSAGVLCALLAGTGAAYAQNVAVPTYEFGKVPEKVKPVEWKVQAKGGVADHHRRLADRTGNLGLTGSRQQGINKLSLEASVAYGRSNILAPVLETNMAARRADARRRRGPRPTSWRPGPLRSFHHRRTTSAYALGQLGADKMAGKKLVGGGQVGYSRQLIKNDMHTAVAELGYDFSYESYVPQPGKTHHAGGHPLGAGLRGRAVQADQGRRASPASVEALFNLNKEKALTPSTPPAPPTAWTRSRTRASPARLGLTTTLCKSLSFGFGFTVKYDQNPAPRAAAPPARPLRDPGFQPFADKVDTLTEATLIYTFL